MYGIVLAGGSGSRLWPLTLQTSKQLLPVYDKPMISYPVSTLIGFGISKILIISDPETLPRLQGFLGNGSSWGVEFSYAVQPKPEGIGQAFEFVPKEWKHQYASYCLILGDNLFFSEALASFSPFWRGARCFLHRVKDPERYGVARRHNGLITEIIEKPTEFVSHDAVTGLYMFDETVIEKAAGLVPSARGELEITDLLNLYITEGPLDGRSLGMGSAWLDTGTFESLYEAQTFVQVIQHRQGILFGSPELAAFKAKFIDADRLRALGSALAKNSYGKALIQYANDKPE